jgi:dipeptidyl aminopeptidase/acylaminoacyl peptidase
VRPTWRPRSGLVICAAVLTTASGPIVAQTVRVSAGNVYYRATASAPEQQLTAQGRDTAATLSPDGATVVFVRRAPGREIATGSGASEATELWLVRVDGTGARRLVASHAAAKMEAVLAEFDHPQFSPDGRRIYFLSAAWATSGAIHVVDVGSGAERFVCAGNTLEMIPRGRYAGHLIVAQHRYFLSPGTYDWFWLLTPEGREVGPIADARRPDADERLSEFRHENIPP